MANITFCRRTEGFSSVPSSATANDGKLMFDPFYGCIWLQDNKALRTLGVSNRVTTSNSFTSISETVSQDNNYDNTYHHHYTKTLTVSGLVLSCSSWLTTVDTTATPTISLSATGFPLKTTITCKYNITNSSPATLGSANCRVVYTYIPFS